MFSSHPDYYTKAAETRPLEVPPDLDTPPTTNELTVPNTGSGAAAAAAAHASATPPAGAMVGVGGNELHRPENVKDTWEHVGSVLQRSDIGKLSNRDESGNSFTFDFDAPMEKPSEGWTDSFKHLLGFGEGDRVKQTLTIFIVEDNGGSRIVVSSASHDHAGAFAQRRTATELEKYVPDAKIIDAAAATAVAPASTAAAPPGMASAPAAASAVPPTGGNELHRAENVQDTWQQVGSVLQRADIGKLSNRDESSHSFTFDFDAPIEKESHNWFKSVLGFGAGDHVKQALAVRIADDNGGSRITITAASNDTPGIYAQRRTAQELAKYVPGAKIIESAPAVVATPVAAPAAATVAPLPAPAPVAAAQPASPPISTVPPGMSNVTVGGSDLHVADTVQSTYTRVGLALERVGSQIGSISGRDDSAHTYTLNFSGTVVTNAEGEHHWYSRVLHPFGGDTKSEQVTRQLVLRVADDGNGAKVSVEGDMSDKLTADAAHKVIEALRDRLS